jgi:hypothetical protein
MKRSPNERRHETRPSTKLVSRVRLFRRSFCGYGFAENPLVAVRTFWGVEIPKLPVELGTSAGLLALTEGEVPDLGEIPEQLSAEIRMRNGDEGLPALTEGLAVED